MKMQSYQFKTVNDCFDFIPQNELSILLFLREIIFLKIPNVKEKLSYNVPFYYGQSRICYLWPASILWGKTKTQTNSISMGFCQGNFFNIHNHYFLFENRKKICSKNFTSIEEIDIQQIEKYLKIAHEIDIKNKNKLNKLTN